MVERARLLSASDERQTLIERGAVSSKALTRARNAAADLQQVERMIEKLDRRFGAYWAAHEMS